MECVVFFWRFVEPFEIKMGGFSFFCRRERDNSEAERAQHLKQIHDLQEHIQEKERQLIELQDQVCSFARL